MLKSLQTIQTRDLMATLERVKVKPSTMLLALGGVLLIAYLLVGGSCLIEKQQQADLKEQVHAGGGTLAGTAGSQQDLKEMQERLIYLKGGLESLQTYLPTKLDSAAIVQSLLSYANESHVTIEQMNALPASEVTAQKEGGPTYSALRYTLVLSGALPDLLSFLSRVEEATMQTAAIGDAAIAENEGRTQMTVGISFYSQSESVGALTAVQPNPN